MHPMRRIGRVMDFGVVYVQGRVSACVLEPLEPLHPLSELAGRDGIPFIYISRKLDKDRYTAHDFRPENTHRLGQTSLPTIPTLLLHGRCVLSPFLSGLTMVKHRTLAFPILLLPIATAWVSAVPHQLQAGSNVLQRDLYGPASAEFFGPYLEEHDSMDPRVSRVDNINGHRDVRLNEPAGRDFDLPATWTFHRIDVLPTGRRVDGAPSNESGQQRSTVERFAKRNIDEIDRTAFDNFFKRNLIGIDRVGWSGFVKRLNDYLTLSRPNGFETVA